MPNVIAAYHPIPAPPVSRQQILLPEYIKLQKKILDFKLLFFEENQYLFKKFNFETVENSRFQMAIFLRKSVV